MSTGYSDVYSGYVRNLFESTLSCGSFKTDIVKSVADPTVLSDVESRPFKISSYKLRLYHYYSGATYGEHTVVVRGSPY